MTEHKIPPTNLKKKKPFKKTTPLKDKTKHLEQQFLEGLNYEFLLIHKLLKHYKIEPTFDAQCWFSLAISLAREHIPAFQKAKKRGPKTGPRNWTVKNKLQLLAMMIKRKEIDGEKTVEAAKSIFRSKAFHASTPDALRRRYYAITRGDNPDDKIILFFLTQLRAACEDSTELTHNLMLLAQKF